MTRIPRINQDLVNEVEDLQAKVQYLIDHWPEPNPEGYTFPDGDHWPVSKDTSDV